MQERQEWKELREEARKLELLESELEEKEIEEELDDELDEVEVEEKAYDAPVGPTTFDELDMVRETRDKVAKVDRLAYDTQDLVHNILYSSGLDASEKATKIKAAADGFSKRVQDVMDTKIIKATLEENEPGLFEKLVEFVEKKKLSSGARSKLSDSDFALPSKRKYPIHDKAHVRNALARASQMIKRGGEAAEDAKAALPKIRAAAKKFGIEFSTKAESGFIIEKDATGQYRVIMWPSNNFIDRDGEIISKAAHEDYVAWVNENKDLMPVLLAWHTPGTAFKHTVDFIDFVDGFLFMSAPLEESEAQTLKNLSEEVDLGMSHGSFVLGRDKNDSRVVTKYRMFEASVLPLERAANPFTALETLNKEAQMDIKEFLTGVFDGDEEKAEKYLNRTKIAQSTLQEADVEEKEVKPEAEVEEPAAPAFDIEELIEKVGEEYDMQGLSEFVEKARETEEKVEALTQLVTTLLTEKEEQVAEMITGSAGKRFAWSNKQASQSNDTVIEEDDELNEEMPKAPQGWLNELSGTEAVPSPS